MKFNDKDLSDIITILKGFTPFGGANYELDTKDSVSNGVYFYKNRFREKIIKVPFFVTYPTVERYDYLQSVLAVDEPKRLEFSHLPDRYYLAIPTGDLDFEEFRMNGKGIITFVIPDGVAHSTTYKKVTDYTESDGKMIFNIVNKGNVDALPIITAKMNSENGYLGLVNQTGVMEIGDREIIDSETRQFSERPFDYTGSTSVNKNLLTNTKDFSGYTNLANWKNVGTFNGNVVLENLDTNPVYQQTTITAGKTYTFSAYVKSVTGTPSTITIGLTGLGTATINITNPTVAITTTMERVSVTFTCTATGTIHPRLSSTYTATNKVQISSFKLEENTVATPWTNSTSGIYPISQALIDGAKNVAISNDSTTILDKNLSIINWLNRDHIVVDGTVATSGNHAGSLTFDLPSSGSLFDRIWWRQIFHIGDPSQFGYIKILVSDTDGKFLYGFETMKRKQGYEAECNFLITDEQGGYKTTDFQKKFIANEKDTDNPFNDDRGFSDLIRQDDQVQIYWFGSHIKRTFSELKGKKSAKLHVIIGSMAGKPLVTRMYLDGIKYQKDNVAFDYNIPNPYGIGSNVVINGENKTFLVDNIAKLNHVVDYSKWLKIPVGTSTLEITTSSWNDIKPTISIDFEERWL